MRTRSTDHKITTGVDRRKKSVQAISAFIVFYWIPNSIKWRVYWPVRSKENLEKFIFLEFGGSTYNSKCLERSLDKLD